MSDDPVAESAVDTFRKVFDEMVRDDVKIGPFVIEPFMWQVVGCCVWVSSEVSASVAITPFWDGHKDVDVQITSGDGGNILAAYDLPTPPQWTREAYVTLATHVLSTVAALFPKSDGS